MTATGTDVLKADLPPTNWGRILGATPVVMTVIATLLAGLASSEMTSAQYDRSLAAQLQSKAGDQWNYYQGKKLRSALQRNTLDLLVATAAVPPLDQGGLARALAGTPAGTALDSADGRNALGVLAGEALPKPGSRPAEDARLQAALEAVEASRPDSEVVALLANVGDDELAVALRGAQAQALEFGAAVKSLEKSIGLAGRQLGISYAGTALQRSFTAANLDFGARRYDTEAQLNQVVAGLLELQVRRSNMSAERHHDRSQKFFYGMLAAQTAVIISTLAMAARKRSLLWSMAACAGAAAVAFAIYVYLCV